MRLTLDDAVADFYTEMATRQGRTVEEVVAAQLTRFKDLEPGKPAIVIQADAATTLMRRTGGLPLKDGADLLKRVEHLARIDFEHVEIELSVGQREELAYRAARQGRTVADLVKDVYRRLSADLFHTMGGGEAKITETKPVVAKQAKAS